VWKGKTSCVSEGGEKLGGHDLASIHAPDDLGCYFESMRYARPLSDIQCGSSSWLGGRIHVRVKPTVRLSIWPH
jgi:hypothetical protein